MSNLVDAYGRPIDVDRLTEPQAHPTFAGIRNIYSVAHPSVGLTPERLSAILMQSEWGDPFLYLELAQDMEEKYPHYCSVLGMRKRASASQPVTIEPASKSAPHVRAADFARGIILEDSGLALGSCIVDAQDALGKGFAALEIDWITSRLSGKPMWIPTALKWRDPRWFMFDWVSGEQLLVRTWKNEQGIPTGSDLAEQRRKNMLLIEQTPESSFIGLQPATAALRPYKFVTHVAKAKSGLPIRGGMARSLAWVSLFWNYVMKDWVIFAERFGIPSRIGRYPTGSTSEEQNKLLAACARIGSDATAIIPEVMNIELLVARQAGGARSQSVFQDLTRYIDDLASKMTLGQTLTVEATTKGGSKTKDAMPEHVRHDILASDVRGLSRTFTRDLIRAVVDLNVGPPADGKYPYMQIGVPDSVDTKIFMDAVSQAVDRGVQVSQKVVREKIGVPEPLDGETLMEAKVTGRPDGDAYQESGRHKEDKPSPTKTTHASTHASAHAAPIAAPQTCATLNQLLKQILVATVHAQHAHWNVIGDFVAVHALFRECYEFLQDASDATAERCRAIEGQADASVDATSFTEREPRVLLGLVLHDLETTVLLHRLACKISTLDAGTLNFLSGQLEAFEKLAWKVRSELGAASAHAITKPTVCQARRDLRTVKHSAQHATKRVARAIVLNEMGLVLTVQRSDEPYVMLPGGHLEDNETPEMAAVRETSEETGIDVELIGHVEDFNDEHAERRYFHARHISGLPRSWDTDGGVAVTVRWTPINEAMTILTSEFDRAALAKVLESQSSLARAAKLVAHAVERSASDEEFEACLREIAT